MKEIPVQSVQRAFFILEKLNEHNGATVQALTKATKLPRATVHRLLETLRGMGYVEKDPHTFGYWVRAQVKSLSRGYADQSWILDVGANVVHQLHNKTNLSTVLSTPDDTEAEMVVRVATVLRNPAGGHRTTAGMRVSMGRTCSGHAYLAHCGADMRGRILDKLYQCEDAPKGYIPFSYNNRFALQRAYAEKILASIRKQGYAVGHLSRDTSGKVAVVAVPILRFGDVVGTLSFNCYYSMLTAATLKGHVALLKNAAGEIADAIGPPQALAAAPKSTAQ